MKRRSISGVLFLGFLFNVIYCIVIACIILKQESFKLDAGATVAVAEVFTVPVLYIVFAVISLLMQLVLLLNFSNTMRFEISTTWIEVVAAVLYGGVFRIFYHYIPSLDTWFAQLRGLAAFGGNEEDYNIALNSRQLLDGMIQNCDWIFALSSALFLVGIGMTICFKKFVHYFLK